MFKIFNKFFFFVFLFFSLLMLSAEDEKKCGKISFSRLQFKHREHKGVGFNQGYSSLTALLTSSRDSVFLPYVDGRLHVFNSGYLASNFGVGARLSNPSNSFIFGLNTYYDFRNYKSFSSHQTSGGLEILTKWVDFRVNGYYPFSGKTKEQNSLFHHFQENRAYFSQHVYYSLPSADTELGFTLPEPFKQINLYLAVGGYYLFKQSASNYAVGDVLGGRVRLTAAPADYISFGVDYTIDELFGSRVNGYVSFRVPLGPQKAKRSQKKKYYQQKEECQHYFSSMKRKTQDPIHNEIIPFYSKNYTYAQTGYNFIFVNNENLNFEEIGEGSGSFENPYTTLELAQNNSAPDDIIYVFYGRGTSAGYNKGFTFQSNQILTSSGVLLVLPDFEVPPYTPGKLPFVTNEKKPSNPTILASNTSNLLLNGFNLSSTEGPAVSLNSTGARIENNVISSSSYGLTGSSLSNDHHLQISGNTITGVRAIVLSSSAGKANIKHNTLLPLYSPTNDSAGIYATSLGSLRLNAKENTVTYANSAALGYGVYFSGESSNLATNTLDITKNTIKTGGHNDGISILNSNNSIIHGTIDKNTVLPLSAEQPNKGILIFSSSSEPLCINVINNDNVLGYSFLNIGSATFQLPSVNSAITGVLEQNGNTAAGNYTTVGKISYVPPGSPCPPFEAVFVNNTADPSKANGSYVYPWTTLRDAQTFSSIGDLIYVFTGDGTTKGYNQGIGLKENQTIAGSTVSFSYKGSTIEGSGGTTLPQITGPGIAVIRASTNSRIVGLGIKGSGEASSWGIEYFSALAPNPIASIEQCNISMGGGESSGIFSQSTFSNLTLSILDNTISSSNGDGIVLNLDSTNNIIINGNNFSGFIGIDSNFVSGTNSIDITNNTFNNGLAFLITTENPTAILKTVIQNNLILNSNYPSLINTSTSSEKLLFAVNNNTFTGPTPNGGLDIACNLGTGSFTKNVFLTTPGAPGLFQATVTNVCFSDFSENNAASYIFDGASSPATVSFQQSQYFVEQRNPGRFIFNAYSGGSFTQSYGTPCP